jgi:hypothetical protein
MSGPQAASIRLERRSTLTVRPGFAPLPESARSMLPWERTAVWLERNDQNLWIALGGVT